MKKRSSKQSKNNVLIGSLSALAIIFVILLLGPQDHFLSASLTPFPTGIISTPAPQIGACIFFQENWFGPTGSECFISTASECTQNPEIEPQIPGSHIFIPNGTCPQNLAEEPIQGSSQFNCDPTTTTPQSPSTILNQGKCFAVLQNNLKGQCPEGETATIVAGPVVGSVTEVNNTTCQMNCL